eukprot:TRINITY_DN10528_c0_g1_i1.p1 TRINITY_DN10528_c0_g1~~TRINITY_DN10528_c0_g1_i1.p1  ORF type:complete len:609 (+),score=78.26 TRINITY_DN10528_c0_g1_i1:193-2019(+)
MGQGQWNGRLSPYICVQPVAGPCAGSSGDCGDCARDGVTGGRLENHWGGGFCDEDQDVISKYGGPAPAFLHGGGLRDGYDLHLRLGIDDDAVDLYRREVQREPQCAAVGPPSLGTSPLRGFAFSSGGGARSATVSVEKAPSLPIGPGPLEAGSVTMVQHRRVVDLDLPPREPREGPPASQRLVSGDAAAPLSFRSGGDSIDETPRAGFLPAIADTRPVLASRSAPSPDVDATFLPVPEEKRPSQRSQAPAATRLEKRGPDALPRSGTGDSSLFREAAESSRGSGSTPSSPEATKVARVPEPSLALTAQAQAAAQAARHVAARGATQPSPSPAVTAQAQAAAQAARQAAAHAATQAAALTAGVPAAAPPPASVSGGGSYLRPAASNGSLDSAGSAPAREGTASEVPCLPSTETPTLAARPADSPHPELVSIAASDGVDAAAMPCENSPRHSVASSSPSVPAEEMRSVHEVPASPSSRCVRPGTAKVARPATAKISSPSPFACSSCASPSPAEMRETTSPRASSVQRISTSSALARSSPRGSGSAAARKERQVLRFDLPPNQPAEKQGTIQWHLLPEVGSPTSPHKRLQARQQRLAASPQRVGNKAIMAS